MLGLTRIPQAARNIIRFQEIAQVIAKHGFGDVLERLGLQTFLHTITFKIRRKPPEKKTEVRLREAIEDLGATFIKLGQILATRPDLIPMSMIRELERLQDNVKAVDSSRVEALLEQELGRPPSEIFVDFNPEPLAAASIGQVHRAKLTSGEEVVLKVQRPGLETQIETDLSIILWLAEVIVENIPESRRYDPIGLVHQFERSILREIDFTREAMHMQRFAKNFANDERVYVPKVYEEWTTSKILCEEFIQGEKATSPNVTSLPLERRKEIAESGIHCILQQTFVHGFFHADPHPGNIFIIDSKKFCFIDYGMMGNLDDERIDEILSFLVAILTRDADAVIRLFQKLDLIDESVNERGLKMDLLDLLERYGTVELSKIDIGELIFNIFDVISRHEIVVPSDLLLVGKALATIDGVAREIYPELEPLETIRPKILEIYLSRLADPKRMLRTPRRIAQSTYDLMQSFPKDARLTMRKLREGELVVNLSLTEFSALIRSHNRAQNRLFVGLIVAALILASAGLLSDVEQFVTLFGFQIHAKTTLGLAFLALSIVYGFVLIIGFFRSDGV
jgi:ubiquinone biosynthesis protein